MNQLKLLPIAVLSALLVACGGETEPLQVGTAPELPEPKRGLLPDMVIAEPAEWGDRTPTVPEGYTISAIATDLLIPRQTLLLPNGDILVAEGRGGNAPALKPKDVIAGYIKAKGNTSVESGNRLTLLRDEDGDGTYELQTVFADNLNAPYGLALVDNNLYVANQDALVRFDYEEGQTEVNGEPETITELPSAINHHWTKAMTASADGQFLYVGIGSNSNITERGMTAEVDRAVIWQIDRETGAHKTYATGVRNPTALAIQPGTDQQWAAVNERDEIGPNLVPDYLTSIEEGGFYGWPYSYWGQNVDGRVRPQDPDKVAAAITPDYSLGAHVAALGLDFSVPAMGEAFAEGAFVGEHGSWNRADPVGYKVVFVPFKDGRPAGEAVDFVAGFRDDDGTTRGRPVGVTVDPRGALIVADDLSNTIWRVVAPDYQAGPIPAAQPPAGQASPDATGAQTGTTEGAAGATEGQTGTTGAGPGTTDGQTGTGETQPPAQTGGQGGQADGDSAAPTATDQAPSSSATPDAGDQEEQPKSASPY